MEAFFLRELEEGGGGARFWLRQGLDHVVAALTVHGRRRTREGGMGGWGREIRMAARSLRRAPMYTVSVVVTLGLGVAASTAAFTVLDRVVLRPLPYPDSDRLVIVGSEFSHDPGGLGSLSVQQMDDLVASPGPAEAVTGITYERRTITGLGDPERLNIKKVGNGFFELFGARPAHGRLLGEMDQRAGAAPTVVIGYGFWQERFGGDPAVVGRSLSIDGEPYDIVGVLSSEFVLPESAADVGSIWAPAQYSEGATSAGAFGITAFARLAEGIGPEVMEAYVDTRFPELHGFLVGGTVRDYRAHSIGDVGGRIGSAVAGVALLLLIGCVNVASLMLTRARSKEHEMSVRVALGAGRRRLVGELLTEAGLLSLAGGVLGGALAVWMVNVFRTTAPVNLPRLAEVSLDTSGLLMVGALSAFTLLAAGVTPAVMSARRAHGGAGGGARGATASRSEARARSGLILVETALAVVLVVGSGLLANDLIRLTAEDRGFQPEGLASVSLDLAGRQKDRTAYPAYWDELVQQVAREPAVSAAALTSVLPYDGVSTMQTLVPEGAEEETFVVTISVGSGYFELINVPVLEGRSPNESELRDGAPVVVVNQAFVRSFWPEGDALGRVVRDGGEMDEDVTEYTVIGVVGDLRTRPGASAPPQVFFGLAAEPRARMHLVVRADLSDPTLMPGIRRAVWSLEPDLPVGRTARVTDVVSGRLDRPRFYAGLFGGFAALALLLALVGVYGTTAYATRARSREIGIRLVLGARRGELVGSVLSSTCRTLGAGVAVGLVGAAIASRALGEVLLYVTPRDLVTYGAVGITVLVTGIVAAAQPAVRSSRVDPVTTLNGS